MSRSYKLRNKDNTPNDFVVYAIQPTYPFGRPRIDMTFDERLRDINKTIHHSHLPKDLRQKKNKSKRRRETLSLRLIEKYSHIDDYDIPMPHNKNDCGSIYW